MRAVDGRSTASVANEGTHHADWSWETVLCINDVLPFHGLLVYCHAHLSQCKQQRVLLKQQVFLFHCAPSFSFVTSMADHFFPACTITREYSCARTL